MSRDQRSRADIEETIGRERRKIAETIDELDARIQGRMDIGRLAADNVGPLMAAGAAFGFLLGYGVPKVFVRTIQIAVPLLVAVKIVGDARCCTSCEDQPPERT